MRDKGVNIEWSSHSQKLSLAGGSNNQETRTQRPRKKQDKKELFPVSPKVIYLQTKRSIIPFLK